VWLWAYAALSPFPTDYKINNRKHSNELNRMEIKENGLGKRLRRVRQLREPRFVCRMYPIVSAERLHLHIHT